MRSRRLAGRGEQTPSCTCTKITKIDNKGLKKKKKERSKATCLLQNHHYP